MSSYFANKTVLVTGCNGFLGKLLLKNLFEIFDDLEKKSLSSNHSIIAIDNGITSNVGPNKYPAYVEFHSANAIFFDYKSLKTVDIIFHLAGLASPAQYKRYPLETIDVAVTLTKTLLEQSLKWKSKFIYFSSSEIYGNPDPSFIPTPETYNGYVSCLGPRSCYDESKRLGETLCYVYNEYYSVDTVIIRPFNVYGPGMGRHDYRMIPNLMRAAIENKVINIYGTGSQTRTFCYIEDAIIGILKAAELGKSGSPYNIGCDKPEISMLDLIKIFNDSCDVKISVEVIDYPAHYPGDEPMRRCPNISRAKLELGYDPKTSLAEGLDLTYKWAKVAYIQQ